MISITQPVVIWARPHESRARRDITRPRTELPATVSNGKRQNSRLFLGCLLVAGIGFTAFCLLKRSRKQAESPYIPLASEQTEAPPSHIRITALEGTKDLASTKGLLHYKNKETRDIQWNENGLPTRITIEREYYQLP